MENSFASHPTADGGPFHGMTPILKVLWTLIVVGSALIVEDLPHLLIISGFILFDVAAAGMAGSWLRFMKYTGPMLGLVLLVNSLLSGVGSRILLASPWRLPIFGRLILTVESLSLSLIMALRLLITLTAFLMFTLASSPDEVLSALSSMGIPSKTMVASYLSLRLIPTLMEDLKGFSEVMRSKGLSGGGEGRSLLEKVRSSSSIIVPLLSNSLERAIQLAEAMEARAFGALKKRSTYRVVEWGLRENSYLASFTVGSLLIILGSRMGLAYPGDLWLSAAASLLLFVLPVLDPGLKLLGGRR
ncbi:MAG: energy-coupling factor transporter transmembrane component T [Candidatus Bathyarchaeia archaeon]|nr:energy-coupling factor transporter transmembrane protein EcfT [Candidatus Bathyarchaeota archaeon]